MAAGHERPTGIPEDYPDVFGFWTNKGGVGKTTLTFHMATTYAKLFPKKRIVVIDMCPQCNLSATLLTRTLDDLREPGDVVVERMREKETVGHQVSKTIGGYLMNLVRPPSAAPSAHIPVEKYLIKCHTKNPNVPKNMYLVCGDTNLDLLAPRLSTMADGAVAPGSNPYLDWHYTLKNFIEQLKDYFDKSDLKMVVFIDTNPAFSIYTQVALCAMTQLVIPVNADTFSLQAVRNMYNLLYGLYPTQGRAKEWEQYTFAYKAKQYDMNVPAITAIIHNRNPVLRENGPDGGAENPAAYKAMAAEQVEKLYDGFIKAAQTRQLTRVFSTIRETNGTIRVYNSKNEFQDGYVAAIRDMRSCGVAALHSGFPIWQLLDKYKFIDSRFKVTGFSERVPYLIKDMLNAMEVVVGHSWVEADDTELAILLSLAAN